MNMGGCQLLIMNMAKELISRGNKVIVFCKYIDDIIIDHSPNVSVNAFDKNWKKDSIVKESIRSFQNVNIVTFIWDDYCRLYSLSYRKTTIIRRDTFYLNLVCLICCLLCLHFIPPL